MGRLLAAATAMLVLLVELIGAQTNGQRNTKLSLADLRMAAPSRDWVAVVDAQHDLVTLTRSVPRELASVMDVRMRHISGDNFGRAAVSTSQRQRDEARRVLEARARSEGLKLVATSTDTTIGCRFVSGVRWTLASIDVKSGLAREEGLLYYWTPSDYRIRRRAVEVRWHSSSSLKKAAERSAFEPIFRLIESLREITPTGSVVC